MEEIRDIVTEETEASAADGSLAQEDILEQTQSAGDSAAEGTGDAKEESGKKKKDAGI